MRSGGWWEVQEAAFRDHRTREEDQRGPVDVEPRGHPPARNRIQVVERQTAPWTCGKPRCSRRADGDGPEAVMADGSVAAREPRRAGRSLPDTGDIAPGGEGSSARQTAGWRLGHWGPAAAGRSVASGPAQGGSGRWGSRSPDTAP